MKLKSLQLILILGVMGLGRMTDGLCLLRNSISMPEYYWYQCFKSDDYLLDLKRAPDNIFGHVVSNSKIQLIRNGSFTRFSKNLEHLGVLHCRVEDIEDDAFQGLAKLTALNLEGNKLRVIKTAWFKDLPKLTDVSFRSNQIKHVDEDFFSTLPHMDVLDISSNQLTCLPTASFGNFNASQFYFQHNPFTWMCQLSLMDWPIETEIDEDCPGLVNSDVNYELAKICLQKLPKSGLNEYSMKRCAEETSRGFLPTSGKYTVRQVCEHLANNPFSLLNCTQ